MKVFTAFPSRAALRKLRSTRRISPNTCGVISLTLPIGVCARGSGVQTHQQIGQPTEVVEAEMRPARADHHRRIVGHDIGPLERKPGEVSRVVVEIDAVLAPRLTAID
jgi:hypothetical protein